jgi:hypothetical protein
VLARGGLVFVKTIVKVAFSPAKKADDDGVIVTCTPPCILCEAYSVSSARPLPFEAMLQAFWLPVNWCNTRRPIRFVKKGLCELGFGNLTGMMYKRNRLFYSLFEVSQRLSLALMHFTGSAK